MAAEGLPSEFDVVILGTGLVESVVAAACSRVGQRVLHLDRRSHYAGDWASFTFNGLLTWIQQQQEEEESQCAKVQDHSGVLEDGEELIYLSNSECTSISNLQVFCFTSEEDEDEAAARPNTEEAEEPGAERLTHTHTHTGAGGGGGAAAAEEEQKQVEDTEEGEGPGSTEPRPPTEEGEGPGSTEPRPPTEEGEGPGSTEPRPPTEEGEGPGSTEPRPPTEEGEGPGSTEPRPPTEEGEGPRPPVSPAPMKKKMSFARLLKDGRRFNIDLVSKLVFSRGSLVDLLIKSNVSRYAEFKNVSRILTYRHGNVQQVPCSRADVFASRQLSVVEKRKLMRFLTSCVEETEEQRAHSARPYSEFLRERQLGDNLQHFLLHSIAMVTEDTPTGEALAATRHFLRCLGRYGNTPFLFPVYGLGEIPQCFCRMSAVFGGIYCLRHSLQAAVRSTHTHRCVAVIDSQGQRISCSHLVVEQSYVSAERKEATPTRWMSRAVLITDSSLLPCDSEQQVSMVTVPPDAGRPAVKLVELSPSTMTCSPGTYLVHLTCQSSGSAHQDLSPLVTEMFHTPESKGQAARPSVLWCVYFNMVDGAVEVKGHDLPSNMYMCGGPDSELGHTHAVSQAERIFHRLLPEEEFCPPAPNPEDILYLGEGEGPGGEGEGPLAEGEGPSIEGTEPQAEGEGPSAEGEGPSTEGEGPSTEGAEPLSKPQTKGVGLHVEGAGA